MSSALLSDILDLIVDALCNKPAALKACCLVSKSWIPRTRRHLFLCIEFNSDRSHIKSWARAFPDPSNSPARHTRKFHILGLKTITSTDAPIHIPSFCRLTELKLQIYAPDNRGISLAPLHRILPILKSLLLSYSYFPPWEVLDLICSFPLLEDLSVRSNGTVSSANTWNIPLISPRFTGSLRLDYETSVARRLFDLSNGLHFSKITLVFPMQDIELTRDLVLRCSETMESLRIDYYPHLSPHPLLRPTKNLLPPIGPFTSRLPLPPDLSNAAKLQDIEICWSRIDAQWITITLQTAPSKSLRQITLQVFTNFVPGILTEERLRELGELDCSLVQLWNAYSILPRILCYDYQEGTVPKLFPELVRRGVVLEVESVVEGDLM